MSDPVYEMMWDCPRCETPRLLGKTHRYCPNCGAPQDPDKRYFPSEGEEVAVEDHVFVGVDKGCPACETPNAATAKHCISCGSPMDEAAHVDLKTEEPTEQAPPPKTRPPPRPAVNDKAGSSKLRWGCLLAVVLLFIVAAIGCCVANFWTQSETLEVTGHRWERTIQVQEYKTVSDSSWCDETPRDAYDLSKSKKERSTKKIQDGETCSTKRKDQGDGTYKKVKECKPKYREEPVYDQWCSYKVDKWANDRRLSEKGSGLSSTPKWPSTGSIKTCSSNRRGCERAGSRDETYTVELRAGSESYTCDVGEAKWKSMAVGSKWSGEVRVMTGGVDCSTLKAN